MDKKAINIELYRTAYDYLQEIAPPGIDLEKYFVSDSQDYSSLIDVFKQFITSAQDYRSMPSVIAFEKREPQIREILKDYDLEQISKMSENDLYHTLRDKFDITSKDNKRNSWYKWSCSVVDSAKFVGRFKDADDFARFIDRFDYNVESRAALALFIQNKIRGVGFALACNSLKELGYMNYPKPDVHLMDVFHSIGLSEYTQMSTFEAIIDMAEDCKTVDKTVTPYKVDRVFWLICSGDYYHEKPEIKTKRHKGELIQLLNNIKEAQ